MKKSSLTLNKKFKLDISGDYNNMVINISTNNYTMLVDIISYLSEFISKAEDANFIIQSMDNIDTDYYYNITIMVNKDV